MIKVSVILPIYYGEKTLSKTLDSLLNQTYKDFELIACIDGSLDGSEAILEVYKVKFRKLIVLKNEKNLGLGPTMNRLVSYASGNYIAIAEQDDQYTTSRLEKQVKLLDTKPNIGMVSGIAEFFDGENITTKFPGILVKGHQYPHGKDMFLLNYMHQIKVVNSSVMFRKKVHIDNGLYFTQHYPSISVDWTYVLRFSLVSNIYGLKDVLVKLDRSKNRDSVTSKKAQQFKAARELIRSMYYEFPKIITKKEFKYAFRTQKLLEWSSKYGLNFYLNGVYYVLLYWQDKRFILKLIDRLKLTMN